MFKIFSKVSLKWSLLVVSFVCVVAYATLTYADRGTPNVDDAKMIQTPVSQPMHTPRTSEQVTGEIVFPGDALIYLSSKEIADHNLFLTVALNNIYEKYSQNNDDKLLVGLDPIDILRLHNKACEDNNFEVQVSLTEIPSYVDRNQFLHEIENDEASEEVEKQMLEGFHLYKGKIIERIVDNEKAYIILEIGGWYRMVKDNKGIWKLGWLSRQ